MRGALATPPSLLDDPEFPSLKKHILDATGLKYYHDRDPDLAFRISHRLSNLKLNCRAYLDILRTPGQGGPELDALVEEITIGETYFFRHIEHFEALRDVVFPALVSGKRPGSTLRIWCAGCADGPEPYSLAILIEREMKAQLEGLRCMFSAPTLTAAHSPARGKENSGSGRFARHRQI